MSILLLRFKNFLPLDLKFLINLIFEGFQYSRFVLNLLKISAPKINLMRKNFFSIKQINFSIHHYFADSKEKIDELDLFIVNRHIQGKTRG